MVALNAVAETRAEPKSRRIQVDLPPRSARRLDDLKELIEANTTTEVFKAALRVLEEIALRYAQGDELYLKQKDGKIVPYPIFKV